jgi:hypothetical protein
VHYRFRLLNVFDVVIRFKHILNVGIKMMR